MAARAPTSMKMRSASSSRRFTPTGARPGTRVAADEPTCFMPPIHFFSPSIDLAHDAVLAPLHRRHVDTRRAARETVVAAAARHVRRAARWR